MLFQALLLCSIHVDIVVALADVVVPLIGMVIAATTAAAAVAAAAALARSLR